MKNGKRLLAIFCILGLLTACAGQDEGEQNTRNSLGDAKTTITLWAFPVFAQENSTDGSGTYEKKVIAAFEKKNPDIHVELRMIDFTTGPAKIEEALGSDSICDVLLDAPGRIVSYGKKGYLANLNDLFTEEFQNDVGNEALLNACKDKDNAYMYPLSSSPFYMAFNEKMLKKSGVSELVREGWTTDDFTKVMKGLHKKGYIPGSIFYEGTGGDQGTRAFVSNLYSGSITDDRLMRYTVNDDKGIKALNYLKNAVKDGLLADGRFNNGSRDIANFACGQTSFTLLWGASQQKSNEALLETNHIQVRPVPFPSEDGTPKLEYLVNGFCVFDKEDMAKINASKRLIQFLCDDSKWGPRDVVQSGCIPVRRSFGDLYSDKQMSQLAKWTKYYAPYYNTMDGYSDMRVYWYQMLQDILCDEKTVSKAADDFVMQSEAARKGVAEE